MKRLSFFSTEKQKTTEQVECERDRFPKPQRTRCKWRMIKKENIWWAEHSARTRQSHVSGKHIPTTHIPKHTCTHTPKHLFMHAHSNQPAPELANKQKKKSPLHTYTHEFTITHMHARCTHCAGAHAQQGAVREKEKRKGKSRMWLESPLFRQD